MVTLRERTTQYGIIMNLPHDHTANSVNTAVTNAFADLPPHMKRTLTWDQGVEMAKHQELTTTSGVPDLLRRTLQPLAARRERELQRARPAVFPQGHRSRSPLTRARQPRHR